MRSTKSLADAIGLPDAQDKLRIQRYLNTYEKNHPGELLFHRNVARERLKDPKYALIDDLDSGRGVGGKSSNRRYLFELPEEIGQFLGQAYPLMFKDKKHTAWFVKNFKYLLIPEEY